jgi:cell division protein FtsB
MRGKRWRERVLTAGLILVAVWLVSLIVGLSDKTKVAVNEAREVEGQYRELEARKTELAANVAALGTERGKDAAIRTAFGVARPGEEVIVVVPPALPPATTTPSWWERLWGWFK